MKPRTDDEMAAAGYGFDDWTPAERQEYEAWLDQLDADSADDLPTDERNAP